MRIAILFDNFGPYHVARLSAVGYEIDVLGVEFFSKSKVYDWERPNLPKKFSHRILFRSQKSSKVNWNLTLIALENNISPFKPDAIAIPGWSSPTAIVATHWAKKHHIPVILMSESNSMDFRRKSIVEYVKKLFVAQFSSAFCGSDLQKEYLIKLGIQDSSIFIGYNAIDNEYYSNYAKNLQKNKTLPRLNKEKLLDEKYYKNYFLTSARFIPKKNILRLLDAYSIYQLNTNNNKEPWPLIILGDGEMRQQVEKKIEELNIEKFVYLVGFRQYNELPTFYAAAGAFILASTTEQWGLVINEAMASGLPILVSNRVGCSKALISEAINGYTFDPYNIEDISNKMNIIANCNHLKKMGGASQEIIFEWGTQRFAKGITDSVKHAMFNSKLDYPFSSFLVNKLFYFLHIFRAYLNIK